MEYQVRSCQCARVPKYGYKGMPRSDTSDSDEYDQPRRNAQNPRLEYMKSDRSGWSSHKYDNRSGLNDQEWNTINTLRQKACRFITSETDDTNTDPPAHHNPRNEIRYAGADLLRRANDLIDYAPQSEFLKRMKQQCQYLSNNQPNIFSTLDQIITDYQRPSTAPATGERMRTTHGYVPPVPKEPRKGYFAQEPLEDSNNPHCSRDEKLLDQLIDKRLPSEQNVGKSKQRVDKRLPSEHNIGQSKQKGKKKSEHISRSKQPTRCRGRRKRKSGSSEKCESEDQFEPTLKKPHENSCERCWRYASPARSPVNKPDQKFDPNFRRGHSCYDFERGDGDLEIDLHVSPCKNLQPITSRETQEPSSVPASVPQKLTAFQRSPAPASVAQKHTTGQQFPVPAAVAQKRPAPQKTPAPSSVAQKYPTPQKTPPPTSVSHEYATPQQTPLPASIAQRHPTPYPSRAPATAAERYPTFQQSPEPVCIYQKHPTPHPSPAPANVSDRYATVQMSPPSPHVSEKYPTFVQSPPSPHVSEKYPTFVQSPPSPHVSEKYPTFVQSPPSPHVSEKYPTFVQSPPSPHVSEKYPTFVQSPPSPHVSEKYPTFVQSPPSPHVSEKYPTCVQSPPSPHVSEKYPTFVQSPPSPHVSEKYPTFVQSPPSPHVSERYPTFQMSPPSPHVSEKYPTFVQSPPSPHVSERYPTFQMSPPPTHVSERHPTFQQSPAPASVVENFPNVSCPRRRTPERQQEPPVQRIFDNSARINENNYEVYHPAGSPERSVARVPTPERPNQINYPVSLWSSSIGPRPRTKSCIPDISPTDMSRYHEGIDDLNLTEYRSIQKQRESFFEASNTSLPGRHYSNVTQQPLLESMHSTRYMSPPRACPTGLGTIPEASHSPGSVRQTSRHSPVNLGVQEPFPGQCSRLPPGSQNGDPNMGEPAIQNQRTPTKATKSPSPKSSKARKSPVRRGSQNSSGRGSGSSPKKSSSGSAKKGKSKSPSPKSAKASPEGEKSPPTESRPKSAKSPPKEDSNRASDDAKTVKSSDESGNARTRSPKTRPQSSDPRRRETSLTRDRSSVPALQPVDYLGLDHPVLDCSCNPNPSMVDSRQGNFITCCHCNWERHRGQSPRSPRRSPSGSKSQGVKVNDGRAFECPHRRFANIKNEEPNMDRTVSPSFERDCRLLSELQQTPPAETTPSYENLSRIYPPVKKYFMLYMTKCDDRKANDDVEVLVEELTQSYPDKTDSRTKDITEKMKKIMEPPSDSMALRFQKGVSEQCKTPQSSRILYF